MSNVPAGGIAAKNGLLEINSGLFVAASRVCAVIMLPVFQQKMFSKWESASIYLDTEGDVPKATSVDDIARVRAWVETSIFKRVPWKEDVGWAVAFDLGRLGMASIKRDQNDNPESVSLSFVFNDPPRFVKVDLLEDQAGAVVSTLKSESFRPAKAKS